MSAWIKMIADDEADEQLTEVLNLARTPHGTVDNVMRVHSLRPNTMKGHVILYRAALHDDSNTIPMWFQETISSYVSILNDCNYSYANHWKNAAHLIGDQAKATNIEKALQSKKPELHFAGPELAMLKYAEKLTIAPGEMVESDVSDLKFHKIDDGQILELNQIVGYFNYVNRLLNGLGVTTSGDTVGFYKD
jgi:uncharacterized peroxidase-related enzyme